MRIDDLVKRMNDMDIRMNESMSKTKEDRNEMSEQVKQLQSRPDVPSTQAQASHAPARATSNTAMSSTASSSDIPWDLRTHAFLGRLGWDASGEVLLTRAKELLSQAGIPEDHYFGLSPIINESAKRGSAAQLPTLLAFCCSCHFQH